MPLARLRRARRTLLGVLAAFVCTLAASALSPALAMADPTQARCSGALDHPAGPTKAHGDHRLECPACLPPVLGGAQASPPAWSEFDAPAAQAWALVSLPGQAVVGLPPARAPPTFPTDEVTS